MCGCRSESVLAHIILYGETNHYALSGSQLRNLRSLRKTAQDKIRLRPFLNPEYQKSRQYYLKINLDLACSVVGSSHISKGKLPPFPLYLQKQRREEGGEDVWMDEVKKREVRAGTALLCGGIMDDV